MNISPVEAEEALAAIQTVAQKTRRSIASGGATVTLVVTGAIWLIGFIVTQFWPAISPYVWIALSVLGSIISVFWGSRLGARVHSPAMNATARRMALFWLFLILFGGAAIAIAAPLDGRQVTALILLFALLGHLAMGLLLSFSSVWWPLPIAALVLICYFFLPAYFYLGMGLLGGGTMIALGLIIHFRW